MSRILEDLKLQVELEGYTPGTESFDRELRSRQVDKCKEIRGLVSCNSCVYREECALLKRHLLDMAQLKQRSGG